MQEIFRPPLSLVLLFALVLPWLPDSQPCSFDKVSCDRLRKYCARFGPRGTMSGSCFNSPRSICATHTSNCKGRSARVNFPSLAQPAPRFNINPVVLQDRPLGVFNTRPASRNPEGRFEDAPFIDNTRCINLQRLRRDALEATNKYRQKHGVSTLYYSPELEVVAQTYADQLVAAFTTAERVHHSGGEYGENINLIEGPPGYVSGVTGYKVVDVWYDESVNYDFRRSDWLNGDHSKKIGHFTQLIWKRSREVGHGFATNADCSLMFIVANYYPRGNFINRLRENVMPPLY